MSHNTFGHLFRVTTWGESHGPAIGCVVDGCPPGLPLSEADIQPWLDRRKPGQNRFVTQRREADGPAGGACGHFLSIGGAVGAGAGAGALASGA